MIYAKEVNIANTINVPYLQNATESLDIRQKNYINYNNEKWIGGKEPYTSGTGYIANKLPMSYSFNYTGLITSGVFVCYYNYDWDTGKWSQVDDVYEPEYISVHGYSWDVHNYGLAEFYRFDVSGNSVISWVTVYNETNVNPDYIAYDITDAKMYIVPMPGEPYSKDELDTQIDSRFYSFPNIRTKLKTNNLYGGIITSKRYFLQYYQGNTWHRDSQSRYDYSFRQWASREEAYFGRPTCFNDDAVFMNYQTNIPIIILFASDEEYKAAMCVYTQWYQAPYYPIS